MNRLLGHGIRALVCVTTLTIATPSGADSSLSLGAVLEVSRNTVHDVQVEQGRDVVARTLTGFTARYRAIYHTHARLAVETSLGFARRGGEIQFTDRNRVEAIAHTGQIRHGGLEVPFRVRWTPATLAGVKVVAFGGPTLGLRFGTEYEAAQVVVNQTTGVATLTRETRDLAGAGRTSLSGTAGVELGRKFGDFLISFLGQYRTEFSDLLGSSSPVLGGYSLIGGQGEGMEFALGVTSGL